MKVALLLAALLVVGCAKKPVTAAVPVAPQKLGPPHMECTGYGPEVDCVIVQNKLDEQGRPELTEVGCVLKKIGLLWLLGAGDAQCPKRKAH